MGVIAVIALVLAASLLGAAVKTKTLLSGVVGLAGAGSAVAGLVARSSELGGLALAAVFVGGGLLIGGQVLQRLLSEAPDDDAPDADLRND